MNDTDIAKAHSLMVTDLIKPGADIQESLTPEKCNLLHMAVGVSGEAGELIDAIKKHVVYNKPLDIHNVIEELGDLEFYMEGLRAQLKISREDCLAANVEKLLTGKKARYAKGSYSDNQASDRADKQASETPKVPKISILGHGRHGKDSAALVLSHLIPDLNFTSSSAYAADKVMMPAFNRVGKAYTTVTECFNDRASHRTFWHEEIKKYNTPDKAKLAREIVNLEGNSGYIGMRCIEEYNACKAEGLFDEEIWVDASLRLSTESITSMTIQYDAGVMMLVDNNSNDVSFARSLCKVASSISLRYNLQVRAVPMAELTNLINTGRI